MRIHDLAPDERPRERLEKFGADALSNAELLALILRQGSLRYNVIELAQTLLYKFNLRELSRQTLPQLQKIKGIGTAKAAQLGACFELARRINSFSEAEKITIEAPEDIAQRFMPELSTRTQEHFIGVYLDTRKRIISQEIIFVGTLDSSLVHPREVFARALQQSAAAFIVLHNHPSGDATPSEEDLEVTRQLSEAGQLLGIQLLDHIIIGNGTYHSLRENGFFED